MQQTTDSAYQKAFINPEPSSSLQRGPSSPILDPRLPIVPHPQLQVQMDDSTEITLRQHPSVATLNASLPGVPPIPTTFLEIPHSPGPILQLQPPLEDLAKLKNERDLYRSEMVLARNAEGRLRAQRDQYKALRNDAVQEKSLPEKQVATLTKALEEQRKVADKAQESLRAAESEKDGHIRALKASQDALANARRSWVDEKEKLNKTLLMAQQAQSSAEEALRRTSKQAHVAQKRFKHHLAVSREQTIDARRSLAEVEKQASDALGKMRDARQEKENLVQAKDRLAVELSEEMGSLRQSLSQAVGRESESSEALRKLQKHLEGREETLTNEATALRASLTDKKAAYKKTKKQLADALEASDTLEGEVDGLHESLVRAREKEREAINELEEIREEHEETVVSLRKTHSVELWLWIAEVGRLRLALDDANERRRDTSDALEALQEAMEDQEEDQAVEIATLRTSLVKEREGREGLEEVEADAQETWEGSKADEEPQEMKSDGDAPLRLGFLEDSDEANDSDEADDSDEVDDSDEADDDEENGHQGSDHETDASSDEEMQDPLGVAEDNEETHEGSDPIRVGGDALAASEASANPSHVGYRLSRRAKVSGKRTCPQPEDSDRPAKVRRCQ